jgi:D-glycero-alpha-D-manno-heptose-7-phosphate kinase
MRISFGGGGTEIPPYVDQFGGITVSTSVGVYARCCIESKKSDGIEFNSDDMGVNEVIQKKVLFDTQAPEADKSLKLSIACLRFLESQYEFKVVDGLRITTGSDAPQGSGLGASSVLTISIIKAIDEFFELNLTKSDVVSAAFEIERNILNLSGGKQDHYAATFGGLNYIVYHPNNTASVERIEIEPSAKLELESSLIALYTGTSRESAHIIENQQALIEKKDNTTITSLHKIAEIAKLMRISILKGDIIELGNLLDQSWQLKKTTSSLISNESIDSLYSEAIQLGAYGGKIAGAGGGGFMILLVPPEKRSFILSKMTNSQKNYLPINLTNQGAESWVVRK